MRSSRIAVLVRKTAIAVFYFSFLAIICVLTFTYSYSPNYAAPKWVYSPLFIFLSLLLSMSFLGFSIFVFKSAHSFAIQDERYAGRYAKNNIGNIGIIVLSCLAIYSSIVIFPRSVLILFHNNSEKEESVLCGYVVAKQNFDHKWPGDIDVKVLDPDLRIDGFRTYSDQLDGINLNERTLAVIYGDESRFGVTINKMEKSKLGKAFCSNK